MLLDDDRVARWYRNVARRNETTADVYLRRLGRVLRDVKGIAPGELLSLSQEELDDVAMDCVEHELGRGLLGSTVEGFRKALSSFLAWHRLELKRPIHIPGSQESPNAENARIPEPTDLASLLAVCKARTAAMLVIVAHGGQRLQVVGNIDATDGLRIGDLPELSVADGEVRFETVPTLLRVRRSLSKTSKPYFTFLGPEACRYVQAYLVWRIEQGETLTPESPLISPYGGAPRFTVRNNVSDALRRAMRSVGLSEMPYIWRSYFSNRCLLAEGKGLPASMRKVFMGHTGGIQARYGLQKQLPADVIEEMRSAYAKALPYLETQTTALEDPVPEILEMFLQARGHSPEQVVAMDIAGMNKEERTNMLQEAFHSAPADVAAKVQQRLVRMDEVAGLLSQGWVFKAALPNDQVIVELA